jgi:predicted NBD/HSP70 family sugar kinase
MMSVDGNNGQTRSAGGLEDLRRRNRSVLLELIRARGPVSRGELGRAGGMSAPTVLEIVGELVEEGLVREDGVGPSTGGRRPVLLSLVEDARCSVGLSVGSRELAAVITDLRGHVMLRREARSRMSAGPEALLGQVRTLLGEVLGSIPEGLGEPLGVGLAIPVPVTSATGTVFDPPTFPGWGSVRLREVVETEFGLPVLADNVANAAAVGEHLFGAGQGVRDMFYLVAHRGVGGAAIIQGEVYRGADGGAGEVGHMRIQLDGPRCGCGNYGCLEAFAGRVAIRERAVRALKVSGRREMRSKEVEQVLAEDVVEAGIEGDEIAREVLTETGRYLGVGIANVAHLFNPELVVVGGSTMKASSLLLEPAIEVARQQVLPSVAASTRIVPGHFGEEAGAIGAAALVLRRLFASSVPRRRAG